MNIYGDESGSINNRLTKENPCFVVCLVRALDANQLKKVYKRFVSANIDRLRVLDRAHGKMFKDGKFCELKGSCFDRGMKQSFVDYFSRSQLFELYYIQTDNTRLTDSFCANTSRGYNYLLCKALSCFKKKGLLPDEPCVLQLDERNERTETKYFLQNYLNTELVLTDIYSSDFAVKYFDSSQNCIIQIADVFSNIMYSHLRTHKYTREINRLKETGLLKFVFDFPPRA